LLVPSIVPFVPHCSIRMEQGFSIWAKGLLSVLSICSIVPYIYIRERVRFLLDKVK
jgi:hypothetical protein